MQRLSRRVEAKPARRPSKRPRKKEKQPRRRLQKGNSSRKRKPRSREEVRLGDSRRVSQLERNRRARWSSRGKSIPMKRGNGLLIGGRSCRRRRTNSLSRSTTSTRTIEMKHSRRSGSRNCRGTSGNSRRGTSKR